MNDSIPLIRWGVRLEMLASGLPDKRHDIVADLILCIALSSLAKRGLDCLSLASSKPS
jgi:hypothetical protein